MRQLDDMDLAFYLASAIGRTLRGCRSGGMLTGRELAGVATESAQVLVDEVLRVHRPSDGLLSENGRDDISRLDKSRVWIVDVIDGTKEFSTGRADWTVHVCLTIDGEPGPSAVGLPESDRVFRSDQVEYVDGPLSNIMVMSRNNPPSFSTAVSEKLGFTIRPMGSAGAKMLSVLLGDADAYVHAGGQYEWDQAAPVGVALASGLHASRIDGAPIGFNKRDTYSPDILICRPELADDFIAALGEAVDAGTVVG